ncbi:MAG: hypothetical protein WCP29_15985 [Acidobacteriota bacterium]
MTRALGLLCVVAIAASVAAACARPARDLRPDEAAAGLRAEPGFTTRDHSPIGRELVQILAVRRIGRSSCEVEFTWRDSAPSGLTPGASAVRTSMALFRVQDNGQWRVASLFKVD